MCVVEFLFYLIILYIVVGGVINYFVPTKDELNILRLDKTVDYDNLNSKQKRMCLRRLRLRGRYKLIANELEIINKELGDKNNGGN